MNDPAHDILSAPTRVGQREAKRSSLRLWLNDEGQWADRTAIELAQVRARGFWLIGSATKGVRALLRFATPDNQNVCNHVGSPN